MWFQGLINLWLWVRGGCPLVGIRKPEPQETIVILGPEPKATLFTMMLPVEERHPGAQWKEPKVGMKVKHIGQCLQVLSDTGNPMGPWEEVSVVGFCFFSTRLIQRILNYCLSLSLSLCLSLSVSLCLFCRSASLCLSLFVVERA